MAKKERVNPTDTSVFILLGGTIGVVFDMFYGSTGLPGYDDTLQSCQRLKMGDVIQVGIESLILLGSLYTNSNKLKSFAAGMLFGGLIPKVAAINGPRYILFDFDPSTGQISPIGRLTGPESIAEDVGEYFDYEQEGEE